MKEVPENTGEICPFCFSKTEVRSIACKNCGASRYVGAPIINLIIAAIIGGGTGATLYHYIGRESNDIGDVIFLPLLGALIIGAICYFGEREDVRWRRNFRTRKPV